jgi:hypothetical protein
MSPMEHIGGAHAYIALALATEHQARIRTSFAPQRGARPCGTPS